MRTNLILLLFSVSCTLLYCSGSQANLLVNGDFSSGIGDTATGWTKVVGSGGWENSGGNPGGSYVLNDWPGPVPYVTQTVGGLTSGAVYTLTGDYTRHWTPGGNNESFGVLIDGVVIAQFAMPPVDTWSSFSETFTAADSTVLIGFKSQMISDISFRIDNIVLIQTGEGPAPEPFPWAMFLPAFTGGK